MADEITVRGAVELRRSLAKLGVDVHDFKSVHIQVADFVGARAAQNAPRRSGMLAASWRPRAVKTQASVKFGGAAVPYANAIHWGVGPRPGMRGPHNIRASLFAYNAVTETESTWLEWYFGELEKMVSKVEGA